MPLYNQFLYQSVTLPTMSGPDAKFHPRKEQISNQIDTKSFVEVSSIAQ